MRAKYTVSTSAHWQENRQIGEWEIGQNHRLPLHYRLIYKLLNRPYRVKTCLYDEQAYLHMNMYKLVWTLHRVISVRSMDIGHVCTVCGLFWTVYGHVCTVYGHVCKVYTLVCRLYGHVCKVYGQCLLGVQTVMYCVQNVMYCVQCSQYCVQTCLYGCSRSRPS